MLAAFKAQPIHEFKSRDKSKIESLLAYGDRLLVGLNSGSLRVYLVNEDEHEVPNDAEDGNVPASPTKASSGKAVALLHEEEKFSRKPVQQLAIVKEANLLVSLSDGYLCLHDLQTYQLVERLERTKGATCFIVNSHVIKDPSTNIPTLISRLAVGVKRKVLCWTWQDMEMASDVLDVSMEAAVKSLAWATGTRLVVGMDPGFSVLEVETQEITPINKPASRLASDPTTAGELAGVRFAAVSSSGMGYMGMGSWVPKPMSTSMTDNEVLLAKDVNTLFIDMEGKPLDKRQIPWAVAPEAIGYSYPYLLALLPPERGTLHVRNPDTLNLLQKISLPGASILHVPQPNISLAHAGKGFIVASERTLWRMNAQPYQTQIHELLEAQRYDEAISLLNLLEDTLIDDKAGRVREVMIQKAINQFQQQNYRIALDLLTDAQAPVERVVALYPRSIAGDLSATRDEERVAEQKSDQGEFGVADEHVKETTSTPAKGVLSKLIPGSQTRQDSEGVSARTLARSDTDNMSIRSRTTPAKRSEKTLDRALEGEDLKVAVRALSSFLAQARQEVQRYMDTSGNLRTAPPTLDPETGKPGFAHLFPKSVLDQQSNAIDWHEELLKTAQLIDTTLFKSYMLASPGLAGPLFRLANFCDPDVVQQILYEHDRYSDLIDFLHGKKLHRQALEMLQKFGRGEADAEIPEGMRGPHRTVAYLKQLPPELIGIILEFVRWPIDQNHEVGMEVFLEDSDNAERLPRDKVLTFLANVKTQLVVQYLEHIINELGDQDAQRHQQLVDLYLQEIKSSEIDQEDRTALRTNLENFLRKSKLYSKVDTLRQLPSDDSTFYESRALVLSAMGNHKQALSIYVYQIEDYTKAEDYCNKIFLSEQAGHPTHEVEEPNAQERTSFRTHKPLSNRSNQQRASNIFAVLLGLYLRPPPEQGKRWPQALDLLSKHGPRLPASSTLDLMPDDLAVAELSDYFRGRIRNATSVLRESKIVCGLASVRRDAAERHLLLGTEAEEDMGKKGGRNRRVRITEEDHCKVCHKRFGASAIRVYPDNTVVHYGCIGPRSAEQHAWGSMRRSVGGARG